MNRRKLPGAQEKKCAVCGETVIVSVASLASAEARGIHIRIVCVECVDLDNHVIAPPTAAQKAEVSAAGYDPESWPLQEFWGKVVKRKRFE